MPILALLFKEKTLKKHKEQRCLSSFPFHLSHSYLVGVMIMPGHVVFLWRTIHQHFTLAFFEHNSTSSWNKPSFSFENMSILKSLKFSTSCPVSSISAVFAATHHRSAFLAFFSSSKSRRLSLKTAYSFIEVPGAGRVQLFHWRLLSVS